MELRQLRYFVAVVEEAGFTRAAERLHVAQPGVSAQIKQLERELGQELLDRSGRTVRLTEAGTAVLPYARAALAAADGARLVVDELNGLVRGRVAVGMVTSMPPYVLPGVLADFHRDHPAVEITLVEDDSDGLAESLRTGRLDLAVMGLAGSAPEGVATAVIVDEPVVAAVARTGPLAHRTGMELDELRHLKVISLPRGTGLRAVLDDACAAAGFELPVALEAGDPYVLGQLAELGLGVALVPQSLAAAHAGELHAIPLAGAQLRGYLALAWRAEGPVGQAARTLIERARTALALPTP